MSKKQDQISEDKFTDGLLLPIFAVSAVFLFIVLCFFAYDHVMKNDDSDELVILEDESSNFKIVPEDRGGMKVAYKDKEVFNTVLGDEENFEEKNIKLVDSDEESFENSNYVADESVFEDNSNVATIKMPNSPGGKSTIVFEAVEDNAKDADESKELSKEAENKIKEVAKEISEMKDTTLESGKISSANLVKAEIKKEVGSEGVKKTVVKFSDAPKSISKNNITKLNKSGGTFYVQTSSHLGQAEAQKDWSRIEKKFSSVVSGYDKKITKANVKGKNYYRLSFGPFLSRESAANKCGQLKSSGQDCIIQKY